MRGRLDCERDEIGVKFSTFRHGIHWLCPLLKETGDNNYVGPVYQSPGYMNTL